MVQKSLTYLWFLIILTFHIHVEFLCSYWTSKLCWPNRKMSLRCQWYLWIFTEIWLKMRLWKHMPIGNRIYWFNHIWNLLMFPHRAKEHRNDIWIFPAHGGMILIFQDFTGCGLWHIPCRKSVNVKVIPKKAGKENIPQMYWLLFIYDWK